MKTSGLVATVAVLQSEPANDRLEVNTLRAVTPSTPADWPPVRSSSSWTALSSRRTARYRCAGPPSGAPREPVISPPHFETASQPRTTTVTKRLSRSARSQSSWSPSRPRRSRYSPPPSSASRAAHRLPQSRTILPPRRAHRRAPRGGSGRHRELARRLAFIAGAMPLPQLPAVSRPLPTNTPGAGPPDAFSTWHRLPAGLLAARLVPCPTVLAQRPDQDAASADPPAIGSCQPSF